MKNRCNELIAKDAVVLEYAFIMKLCVGRDKLDVSFGESSV